MKEQTAKTLGHPACSPCENKGRRRFLIALSTLLGGVGVIGAMTPFLAAWQPSARARAAGAPVEVDISKLQLDERLVVEWRGQPIWILRRSEEDIARLTTLGNILRDPESKVSSQQPDYVDKVYRSIRPDILVLVGICTHLGCSPLFEPFETIRANEWPGGFFCPCHGSKFDLAGRVYKAQPAPLNLAVPPYKYLDQNRLLIGVDDETGTA